LEERRDEGEDRKLIEMETGLLDFPAQVSMDRGQVREKWI